MTVVLTIADQPAVAVPRGDTSIGRHGSEHQSLYARALSDREPVSFAATKRLKICAICWVRCWVNLLPKHMTFYELFSKSRRCLPNDAWPSRPARIAGHGA